ALKFSILSNVVGVGGYGIGAIAGLNPFGNSVLYLGAIVGVIVGSICLASFMKLRKLALAKKIMLSQLSEIDEKLNTIGFRNTPLIAITNQHCLAVIWEDTNSDYHAYIASNRYLHYSPVKMNEQELIEIQKIKNGNEQFYELREGL